MKREQYIEMIKTGNFDISIFYEYYTEFNTNELFKFNLGEFHMWFNQYVSFIGMGNVVNTIRKHYDSKFQLASLLNKDGNIIKIY
jgi:hypothetical protein